MARISEAKSVELFISLTGRSITQRPIRRSWTIHLGRITTVLSGQRYAHSRTRAGHAVPVGGRPDVATRSASGEAHSISAKSLG
jgi:hypothetical protein